jgi:hypothetical protein
MSKLFSISKDKLLAINDNLFSEVTEIKQALPEYYYFHLRDPDNNVIEITGNYKQGDK